MWILHDVHPGSDSLLGLYLEISRDRTFGRNNRRLLNKRAGLRMPYYKLVLAGWDIANRESPVLIGQNVVGVVHGHAPGLHIGMETTLHDENPPPLRHVDFLGHRMTRYVLVVFGIGPGRLGMVRVHGQGHIEQDPRPQL